MSKKNIGASIDSVFSGAVYAQAGVTGSNLTAVAGASIDRQGYESGVYNVIYKTTLTNAKTLTLAAEYQESANNSDWDAAVDIVTAELLGAGTTGGSTITGVYEYDINLSEKKRYIKFNLTPTLSATSADVAIIGASVVLGGADKLPK
jgi:hypothetical protein